MKKALIIIGAVTLAACNLLAQTNVVITKVETNKMPWNFTVTGTGSQPMRHCSTTTFGATFGVGYDAKLLLPGEVGLRQSLGYRSANPCYIGQQTAAYTANTELYYDWKVRWGILELFAGPAFNVTYGSTAARWYASPEGGLKVYVKDDVFVYGRANYDFVLQDRTGSDGDALRFNIGVGWKW